MKHMSKANAARLRVEPFEVAINDGCDECGGTGIRGRAAVGELLTVGNSLRKALLAGVKDPEQLRKTLPANWPDLRSDVIERLKVGDFHVEHALTVLNL
jgi:type IV pilus assembly protein PilB